MRTAQFVFAGVCCLLCGAAEAQTITDIYDFPLCGQSALACRPFGKVTLADERIFGVDILVVYALAKAPGNSQLTASIIYNFASDVPAPTSVSDLIAGPAGVLYGTTTGDGKYGFGTVFELVPPTGGKGAWTKTVLADIPKTPTGLSPIGDLTIDAAGNLFGALAHSNTNGPVQGAIYEVSGGQGAAAFNILYRFTGGPGGSFPYTGPLIMPGGALFGTSAPSPGNFGLIWRLNPPASGSSTWTETRLASFTNGYTEGGGPVDGLTAGPGGRIFGATDGGGMDGGGVVYELVPPSATVAKWSISVIANLKPANGVGGGSPGPTGKLLVDKAGSVFGAVTVPGGVPQGISGYAFRLDPPAAGETQWQQTLLGAFAGDPYSVALTAGSDGTLYGVNADGGNSDCDYRYGCGSVFAITGFGYQN